MSEIIPTIAISDLHIGHRHTPSTHILSALNYWLIRYKDYLDKSKLFIISGDFWDKLISMLSDDVQVGIIIMNRIMNACNKHNLVLRIVEGTRSHDVGQCKIFEGLAEAYPDLDYAYVAHASIEIHDGLGKSILYVPDDITDERHKVEPIVHKLLKDNNLDHVDIAIIHTQFQYQLPKDKGIDFSDEGFYTSITRDFIISGHIHPPSRYANIIVPGSFDCIEHGQSLRKGGVYLSRDPKTGYLDVKRLINKKQAVYERITLPKNNPEEFVDAKVKEIIKYNTVRNNIKCFNIQLSGEDEPIINNLISSYSKMYPGVRFTKHSRKKKKDIITSVKQSIKDVKKLQKNVLPDLIKSELQHSLDKTELSDVMKLLKNITQEYNPQ